jgi:hypothetical protein
VLATSDPKSSEYEQAHHELMTIYNGEFQIVASPSVSAEMTKFVANLADRNTRLSDKLSLFADLRSARELALACRQDSGAEFKLEGKDLQEFRNSVDEFAKNWEKWLPK